MDGLHEQGMVLLEYLETEARGTRGAGPSRGARDQHR